MTGNAGDDWIEGGDGFAGIQFIYGDTQNREKFDSLGDYNAELAIYDSGDDIIYGGDNGL